MSRDVMNHAAAPGTPAPAAGGAVIAVIGPGGSGKSTLIQDALALLGYPSLPPDSPQAITCTSRLPRPGEIDGVHYHFLTSEAFRRQIEQGEFLEHDLVQKRTVSGRMVEQYHVGTRRSDLDAVIARHGFAVLALTVPGVTALRRLYPRTHTVLVTVRDPVTLARRMQARSRVSPADIAGRLAFDQHFFTDPPPSDLVLYNEDGARTAMAEALARCIQSLRSSS